MTPIFYVLQAVRLERGVYYVTVKEAGYLRELQTRDATIGWIAERACADGVPVQLDTFGHWLNGVHPDYTTKRRDVFTAEFGINHESLDR